MKYTKPPWYPSSLWSSVAVQYHPGIRDRVEVGDECEEFVDTGCGSRREVVLRVEGVDGGESIGAETTIEFVPRETE